MNLLEHRHVALDYERDPDNNSAPDLTAEGTPVYSIPWDDVAVGSCAAACPPHDMQLFWADASDRMCKSCPLDCKECTMTDGTCTKCRPGTYWNAETA